ncbi:MAG: hypothetical protein JO345_21825 [Streptosporangiaceae bacterium]|nr:hypothetical protein [Streptosporangiaceae bacterium]
MNAQQGFQVTRQVINTFDSAIGAYCFANQDANLGEIGAMDLRTWLYTRYQLNERRSRATQPATTGGQTKQQPQKTMAAGTGGAAA